MRKYIFSFLFLSFYGHATCYDISPSRTSAPVVNITIPEFNGQESVSTTFTTQFNGTYNCRKAGWLTSGSEFSYINLFGSNRPVVIGFYDGKYLIKVDVDHDSRSRYKQSDGKHNAAELNRQFPITFTRLKSSAIKSVIPGGSIHFEDSIIVSDVSGIGPVVWIASTIKKILQWIFNGFKWPYDERDMFSQPLEIKLNPRKTTCAFKSPTTVNLPTIGLDELSGLKRPGYTQFTIGLICQGTMNNKSDRPLKVFLSSNKLLPSNNSVLTDKNIDGVGISLTSSGSSDAIHMSDSPMNIGSATVILDIQEGGKLSPITELQLGAYYVPTNNKPKAGVINTDAVINVLYD